MCGLCGDYDDVIYVLGKCKKYSKQIAKWVELVKKAGSDKEVLSIRKREANIQFFEEFMR